MSFTTKTRGLTVYGATGNSYFSVAPASDNSKFTIQCKDTNGDQLPLYINSTELNLKNPNGNNFVLGERLNTIEDDIQDETNRAINASGKGSKMNFYLEKRVNERDGLATRQNETRVRNEGIGTEKRANGREG